MSVSSSSAPAATPPAHRPGISEFTAILFALNGFTCWVLGDTCIKWIGQFGLPPVQVVAFMGCFMTLTLIVQAALRRNLRNLMPRSWFRQGLRAMLDMLNNVCVVLALRHLSLTMFYILIFTAPLAVAVLSACFLKERLTPGKVLALVVGFCGVVVAVAPWNHNQQIDLIGVGSCLVCVACFSTNMVWSRVLTRTEPPESLAFCSGLVTAIVGLALTSLHPHALTPRVTIALVLMGIFGAVGTLSYYIAVKHTSASNVSQYHYTQLVTGALVSWLVWRDRPTLPVLLGGTLIIGSGILIAMAARTSPTSDATA